MAKKSKAGLREILGAVIALLQGIAEILRKPVALLPTAQDLQGYLQANFTPEEVEGIGGALQRVVDEGVVTGNIWMTMIHNLRRSTDRDMLTRDARHAGLRLLRYEERGIRRYEIHMPILLLVSREVEVEVRDSKTGRPVIDPKTGKPKKEKERQLVLTKGVDLKDLFEKGTKIPVWTPPKPWKKETAYGWAIPKTDLVPDVRVELDIADAIKIGALTTCVMYMLWSEMIRIAPTLALNKRWEEGLPDKVRNHTLNMADDVDKLVPDVGPGLGFVGAQTLAYKYVGMIMTSIMRPNGGLSTTIPEKDQLCNFPNHFSSIFRSAIGDLDSRSPKAGEPYHFREAFPNGRDTCILRFDERREMWQLVSPLHNPFLEIEKEGDPEPWRPPFIVVFGKKPGEFRKVPNEYHEPTYRSMYLNSRLGLLRSCIEFIWVMGWGDPGAQRDLDALVAFKKDVVDGIRDLASQIDDWKIDAAASRPGVKAEEEKKDTDAGYDATANRKNWCHRIFWLARYTARLDRISVRREGEFRSMAAADTLTINVVDEEFNKGFLWRHLTDEERRARFVRIYRLAYEVVEREKIRPAIDREGFGRKQAEDLIGKDLYEHLPPPERDAARGQLLAKGDVGDLGPYMDQTLHVNARVAKSFGLVDKGFACYPTAWMTRPVQDWLRHLIMAIGWYDFVEMDQIVGPFAKSYGVAWDVDGKPTHRKAMVLSAIEGKGGAVDQVDAIAEALGPEARNELGQATQDGREKKAQAERWWREKAWSRWLLMDLIFARFGIKAGLAERWRRIMRVDDPVMANDVEKGIARYSQRNLLGKRREPEANPDYDPDFDVAAVAAKIDKRFEEWGIK